MKPEFVIERGGKQFVLYQCLLDEGHSQGLKRISTMLIQAPAESNGNVAICSAEVETEKGIFSGLGDASPDNVKASMVNCLVRLAETRAKARALRDAVNVGAVAVEELSEEIAAEQEGQSESAPADQPSRNGHEKATERQIKAIYTIAKKNLNLTEEETRGRCRKAYHKLPEMLTRAEASELIEYLQQTQ
ncbi:MAG: hypothetical protein M1358_00740 [Chloroflexi bacterium]|nr:hypothetical protein [Chloroflexota bacterium]